jgi:hypothetical protein
MSGVLSPRRRLYEPEAAGFRPRRTKVRLPAKYMRDKRTKTLACPAIALFLGDGGCGPR